MKVEDVPEEWVALGIKAHELYSPLLVAPMPTRVPSREEMWEAQVRWIIAAVAPAIRRAALEEAAGQMDQKAKALQYMADQMIASSGSAAAVNAASAYYVRATDASDGAAAIRALDA